MPTMAETPPVPVNLRKVCVDTPGRMQQLRSWLIEGKDCEKQGDLHGALLAFGDALTMLPDDERLVTKIDALKLKLKESGKQQLQQEDAENRSPVCTGDEDLAELLFQSVRKQQKRLRALADRESLSSQQYYADAGGDGATELSPFDSAESALDVITSATVHVVDSDDDDEPDLRATDDLQNRFKNLLLDEEERSQHNHHQEQEHAVSSVLQPSTPASASRKQHDPKSINKEFKLEMELQVLVSFDKQHRFCCSVIAACFYYADNYKKGYNTE
jgi:hypothetical protein